jgi:glucose/arabinose dehydrogenase
MYPTCSLSVETGLAASLSPRLQPRLGKKMFVSVGSLSNNDDTDNNPAERDRADILEFNPDGSGHRVYAWGIRNAVGIALD